MNLYGIVGVNERFESRCPACGAVAFVQFHRVDLSLVPCHVMHAHPPCPFFRPAMRLFGRDFLQAFVVDVRGPSLEPAALDG